ncbi:MAG: OmpA family protein [Cytophaga sp.]|uniref:OmpA family protein n=1 Tax=Cytophaga sp. TaxID=29535 RepID=UPI003F7FF80A
MRFILIVIFLFPLCSQSQIFNWNDTTFAPGSYRYFELKINYDRGALDENQLVYDTLTMFLKNHPAVKVEINIHTDIRGSEAYNMALSKRFASQLKNYFTGKSIDSTLYKIIPKGECEPVCTQEYIDKLKTDAEKNEAHRKNRLSKFIIVEETE